MAGWSACGCSPTSRRSPAAGCTGIARPAAAGYVPPPPRCAAAHDQRDEADAGMGRRNARGARWRSSPRRWACHTPSLGGGRARPGRRRTRRGRFRCATATATWSASGCATSAASSPCAAAGRASSWPPCPPQKTLFVCEGPTDTAAAVELGLFAVGRPNCCCGGPEIKVYARRHDVQPRRGHFRQRQARPGRGAQGRRRTEAAVRDLCAAGQGPAGICPARRHPGDDRKHTERNRMAKWIKIETHTPDKAEIRHIARLCHCTQGRGLPRVLPRVRVAG